jgi:DNA-binding NarL/FixJ family response regulator
VIRVLVVATSPAVRVGLAALLSGHTGVTVLESAGGPSVLGDAVATIEADVMLLALEPGEALPLPLRGLPDAALSAPATVILGDEPASTWAGRALRSGAAGALSRTATADQIVAAVMAAAAGLVVREPASSPAAPVRAPVPLTSIQSLTARELEILSLLAEGMGNRSIAARLGISEHTVKSHLGSLFGKLGVSSRAEAVASAARLGLILF